MRSLLHRVDRYVTLNNKFSKIPQSAQYVLQLVCEDRVFSSELFLTFLCAVSTIQNVSEQFAPCIYLYFVIFALYPSPRTKF